jgi:hypothetical protein
MGRAASFAIASMPRSFEVFDDLACGGFWGVSHAAILLDMMKMDNRIFALP